MVRTKLEGNVRPDMQDTVKVKETGHILELMYMTYRKTSIEIQKLNKDLYMDLRTGEVKEFEHHDSRASDTSRVYATLGNLRDYLNTNVTDTQNCRWVTLTYAENMTDTKRLHEDFKNFNKRMRYKLEKQGLRYEHIAAMEPQGRGAWHVHMVMIFPEKAPFIPNKELAATWGHGFVTVRKLDNVDNVGVYLTAYLGDMELQEAQNLQLPYREFDVKEADVQNEHGQVQKKRFVKGARMHMYPPGFNIYRISRGIKKPTVEYMREAQAKEKVGAATPTFESTVELTDPKTGFQTVINKRYFNLLRQNSQEGVEHDGTNSIQGISDHTAATGKQPENRGVLQKVYLSSLDVPWDGYIYGGLDLDPLTELLHELAPAKPSQQQHKKLYQGNQGFFELDVPRGIHNGEPLPEICFAESTAESHRRTIRAGDSSPL